MPTITFTNASGTFTYEEAPERPPIERPPGGGGGGSPPDHPYENFVNDYSKHKSGTVEFPDENTVRCAIRNGDHATWDSSADFAGIERKAHFPIGANIHLDYYFKMEPGDKIVKPEWCLGGEIHNDDEAYSRSTSPPFSLHFENNKLVVSLIAGGNSKPEDNWIWPYTDTKDFPRGVDVHFQVDVKFANDGYCKVRRDGQTIVDYHGKLGYGPGTYWMADIYRDACDETTAVVFSRAQVWTD